MKSSNNPIYKWKTGAWIRVISVVLLCIWRIDNFAASVAIINKDDPGEGLNDSTSVSAVGGNTGTTLGAQRLNVLQRAALIVGSEMFSAIDIGVEAKFDPLPCTVLGGAAPLYNVWGSYSSVKTVWAGAHANAFFGTDFGGPSANEISLTINRGDSCTISWYYGLDGNAPAGQYSLLDVVIHEIYHGLGFQTFVDLSSGNEFTNAGITYRDWFESLLLDGSLGLAWTSITPSQRLASRTDNGDLLWNGTLVTYQVGLLTSGTSGGRARMYAPTTYMGGSSVNHFDSVLAPHETMEPSFGTGAPLVYRTLARSLLWDIGWNPTVGSLDFTFNPGLGSTAGANGTVSAIARQSDGKMVIGGSFTAINGTTRNYLARLNSDGSLDTGFAPTIGGPVSTIAIQSDGKILAGGSFTSPKIGLARFNSNGTLDSGYTPPFVSGATINAVVVDATGKAVVGGIFHSPLDHVVRLTTSGTTDATYTPGTGPNDKVYALAIQSDGKILIGGIFDYYNGVWNPCLVRVSSAGVLDGAFAPSLDGRVESIQVQGDGKIVIGGGFTTVNGASRNRIARLTSGGATDGTFSVGTGASGNVKAIRIQGTGAIVIGGEFTTVNGTTRSKFARLTSSGAVDTDFTPGTGASSTVFAIELDGNDSMLIGGAFSSYNFNRHVNRVARIFQ
jgi:uncharacterized delta-60 repeat protein